LHQECLPSPLRCHSHVSDTADRKALVDALDDDGSGTLSIDELCDFIEVVVRRKKGEKPYATMWRGRSIASLFTTNNNNTRVTVVPRYTSSATSL
jgi:hypothetical protein